MQIKGEAKLLRIFIGEGDKSHSVPDYEKIVSILSLTVLERNWI